HGNVSLASLRMMAPAADFGAPLLAAGRLVAGDPTDRPAGAGSAAVTGGTGEPPVVLPAFSFAVAVGPLCELAAATKPPPPSPTTTNGAHTWGCQLPSSD